MPIMRIEIRPPGDNKSEYSLKFELPEIPRIGDYISIFRPDAKFHSEDVVVKNVLWELDYPSDAGSHHVDSVPTGKLKEIFVECEMAIGPCSRDHWNSRLLIARDRGENVQEFDVLRPNYMSEKEARERGL